MCRAGCERSFALHPERVLLAQLRQVFAIRRVAVALRGKLDHRREERRLRAAEVVAAITVRHVTDPVDQPREVVEHRRRQVVPAAVLQAEHREVRVPVVDLVEAPARHDIAVRQRQSRRVRALILGLALEHFPKRVDVLAHVLTGHGMVFGTGLRWRREVLRDELAQIEIGSRAGSAVVGEHLLWRLDGQCVDEALAIGVNVFQLHALEQFAIDLGGRPDVGSGSGVGQEEQGQKGQVPHRARVSARHRNVQRPRCNSYNNRN